MSEDLAHHAAVAAADDGDAPRVGVGAERQVDDHLLVAVLVALGDLDHTVQAQHRAVRLRAEDLDVLELRALIQQRLLDLQPRRS